MTTPPETVVGCGRGVDAGVFAGDGVEAAFAFAEFAFEALALLKFALRFAGVGVLVGVAVGVLFGVGVGVFKFAFSFAFVLRFPLMFDERF